MSKVSCEAAGKHRRCGFANGARKIFEKILAENVFQCYTDHVDRKKVNKEAN